MNRKVFAVVIIVIVVVFAFPISNLVIALPDSPLAGYETDDPLEADVVAILENKCTQCHSTEGQRPWYAALPIASGMVEADIEDGRKNLDLIREFETSGPIPEVALAKVEYSAQYGGMPPTEYLALHWNHALSQSDRDTLMEWIHRERVEHYATPGNPLEVMQQTLQPLPEEHGQDMAKAELGDKLFHDVRLSRNNTVSCATCHDLATGGTDQLPVSIGIDDQRVPVNSPTVFNSGFNIKQFWDGRAATLEEQAGGPVTDPAEMDSTWEEAAEKLAQDEAFTEEFEAVYPDGYSAENFEDAIATFERTLITPSPFDDYLKGDEDALTAEQVRGYELFKEHSCVMCHAGVNIGGQSFELMGLRGDYFGDRDQEITDADYGRYNVTEDEYDRHRFKTPTLRNVALNFPYMHDGTVETMEEAVDVMMEYMVDDVLATDERGAIVAFLESLTGELDGVPLDDEEAVREANPEWRADHTQR